MPRDHILVRVVGCTNPKEAWHFAAAALAFRVRGEIEFISTTHTGNRRLVFGCWVESCAFHGEFTTTIEGVEITVFRCEPER
uniref:Uncharacterized protein n=1 Tax=viral metagenome TaxID=1070528 RepID=A0A6H1ZTS9_9ZZZZ